MVPVATLVHPHTGRCPTSFPHREKATRLVKTSGTSGTVVPRPHFKVPHSCRMFRPKTRAPSSKPSGSLQIRPNSASWDLTRDDDTTSSFTYMSSRYADVPSFIVSSYDSTALTMVLGCHVQPEAQSGKAVPFAGKYHRLKWPHHLADPDLQIRFS